MFIVVAHCVLKHSTKLHVLFVHVAVFKVKRGPENGGDALFSQYEDLEQMFAKEVCAWYFTYISQLFRLILKYQFTF